MSNIDVRLSQLDRQLTAAVDAIAFPRMNTTTPRQQLLLDK